MLIGVNCSVRYVAEADLERYIFLQARPESQSTYFPPRFKSPTVLQKEFRETGFVTPDYERLVITDLHGVIKGEIVHFKTRADYTREIGYRIFAKADYGKGMATEAVTMLASYLFRSSYLLNRIEIIMPAENAASEQVAKNAGFKKEGVLRQFAFMNGVFWNCYSYSMVRSDFTDLRS